MGKIIRIHLILIPIIYLSCSVNFGKRYQFQSSKRGEFFKYEIPKGAVNERIISGDHEKTKEYWYPDSSVFYITTFHNTYNYDYMRSQGTYYERFIAIMNNDTITLEGTTGNGLYWRDRLLEDGVTVGYSNVEKANKEKFDQAVNSFENRRN
jgi:hypothetical protein